MVSLTFYSFGYICMYVYMCVCVCVIPLLYCTFSCTANPNATAYTDCSARSSSLYYRAERELLPLPSVLLMRAAECASPPVEAPHGLPSCRDLENEKSASYSHTYPFLSCQNYFFRNVSPIYHVRTYTYMPATGFLWTCHICF